jgi:hypothetical protein
MTQKDLEQRLEVIELRNQRVELEKAWETSLTRKLSIAIITYVAVALYFAIVIKSNKPLVDALVPVMGFLLSTLTVSMAKSIWLKLRKA